jgi:hypothetical protein
MQDKLGFTYTDKITGFTGVATGHCSYLSVTCKKCKRMLDERAQMQKFDRPRRRPAMTIVD